MKHYYILLLGLLLLPCTSLAATTPVTVPLGNLSVTPPPPPPMPAFTQTVSQPVNVTVVINGQTFTATGTLTGSLTFTPVTTSGTTGSTTGSTSGSTTGTTTGSTAALDTLPYVTDTLAADRTSSDTFHPNDLVYIEGHRLQDVNGIVYVNLLPVTINSWADTEIQVQLGPATSTPGTMLTVMRPDHNYDSTKAF